MIVQAIAFYIFATVAVAAGVMVISARNPVHSVLFLILAFFNAAGLFVLLGAEFIAMILVIVYVGAVAVLFLFVVMMLDINFVELRQGFLQYLPIGGLIGFVLLVELVFILASWTLAPGAASLVAAVGASVQLARMNTSSTSSTTPISPPIGRYWRKPWRSSTKLISSIITTNRNSTATAPT